MGDDLGYGSAEKPTPRGNREFQIGCRGAQKPFEQLTEFFQSRKQEKAGKKDKMHHQSNLPRMLSNQIVKWSLLGLTMMKIKE